MKIIITDEPYTNSVGSTSASSQVPESTVRTVGPNGYQTGYDDEGNFVEWIPDEEDEGELYPIILRRNDKAILKEYNECRDRIWWNRHQVRLLKLEKRTTPLTNAEREIYQTAFTAARQIEMKYGVENLIMSDFDLGLWNGRMSALAWVLGSEWEDSLDT